MVSKWRAAVGLEVHAQISSTTKLFSRGSTKASSPRRGIQLFDIATPGTLPVLNRACVAAAIQTAAAFSSKINLLSYFDRKHYFYPDLPNGYQITQKRKAIAEDGYLEVPVCHTTSDLPETLVVDRNEVINVNIRQIQLEQDSGKTLYHMTRPGKYTTEVDFSRSGCGLMEIVTSPCMSCGTEAVAFVKELRLLLKTIGTCDGNMQDGSFRVDANISVAPDGSKTLGTRTEVKNINGLRFLHKAVDFEIKRHIQVLDQGCEVKQETRSFDAHRGVTVPTRGKGLWEDYRFLPEPDLPAVCLVDEPLKNGSESHVISIQDVTSQLPTLPMAVRKQIMAKHGLNLQQCSLLMDRNAVNYFEEMLKISSLSVHKVYSWLTNDLFPIVSEGHVEIDFLERCPISPIQLISVYEAVKSGRITRGHVKKVLTRMLSESSGSTNEVIIALGISQLSDMDQKELEAICIDIISSHPKEVQKIISGKKSVLDFLVSLVRNSNPTLKPQQIKKVMKKLLNQT